MINDKVTFDLGSGCTVTAFVKRNYDGYYLDFTSEKYTNDILFTVYSIKQEDLFKDLPTIDYGGIWSYAGTEELLHKQIELLKQRILTIQLPNPKQHLLAEKFGCQQRFVIGLINSIKESRCLTTK